MTIWLELHGKYVDSPMLINMDQVKQIIPNGAKADGSVLYFGVKADYEFITVRETYDEIRSRLNAASGKI